MNDLFSPVQKIHLGSNSPYVQIWSREGARIQKLSMQYLQTQKINRFWIYAQHLSRILYNANSLYRQASGNRENLEAAGNVQLKPYNITNQK